MVCIRGCASRGTMPQFTNPPSIDHGAMVMDSHRSRRTRDQASRDSHGGETANDSTILAIISLPVDVDFLLVFKVFVSLSQLVLFSLHVRESWN